ncbi:MAG: GGDEF domain-containing protein [Eubacteriales bacterium]|nr:GGDEF domain-containing protein [Eubacteriales bacterium]
MNHLALIMYVELDIFCMLLLLYLTIKSFNNIERRESWRFFQWALVFIILFVLSDLVWKLMECGLLPNRHPLPHIVNSVYFVFSVLGTSSWFFYTEASMDNGNTEKRSFMLWTSIPFALMLLLLVVNFFNGCLFSFDEEGLYVRGPLNLLSFIMPQAYLLFSAVHPLSRLFRAKYYSQREVYFSLSSFALITLIASTLQILVPGSPLPCLGITVACVFVYINSQQLMVSIDPLTKLNNRHHMTRYLEYKMEHSDNNVALFLLIIDLDHFKQVNDTYGHVEGDRALIRLARVLQTTASAFNCFAARYGGDEFILIFETTVVRELEDLIHFFQKELAKSNRQAGLSYDLSASVGYAKYNKEMKYVPDFIASADEALYQAKAARR